MQLVFVRPDPQPVPVINAAILAAKHATRLDLPNVAPVNGRVLEVQPVRFAHRLPLQVKHDPPLPPAQEKLFHQLNGEQQEDQRYASVPQKHIERNMTHQSLRSVKYESQENLVALVSLNSPLRLSIPNDMIHALTDNCNAGIYNLWFLTRLS